MPRIESFECLQSPPKTTLEISLATLHGRHMNQASLESAEAAPDFSSDPFHFAPPFFPYCMNVQRREE